jgi:hypothetical protein
MNKEFYQLGRMVALSALLGVTALLVSFVAGSAFDTPCRNSPREVSAAWTAGALYLAYCQFWVAPRSAGWSKKLFTVTALMTITSVIVDRARLRKFAGNMVSSTWQQAGILK